MASFEPKAWVNPFGKMSIFLEYRKSQFLEYRKSQFPNQYCRKKMLEKWPYWDEKSLVNPFGKMSIFRLLEVLLFIA